MYIDKFTKSVLLVIAVSLGIIALNPWLQPTVARASATKYGYIKSFGGNVLLDTRNGDLWNVYTASQCSSDQLLCDASEYVGTMTELGKPLIIKKELAK